MSSVAPLRIAVVGGGIAGSVCASLLANGLKMASESAPLVAAAEVVLFDSGAKGNLGGRASSRSRVVAPGSGGDGNAQAGTYR